VPAGGCGVVLWVASRFLFGVDPFRGYEFGESVADADDPSGVVDQSMVDSAEHDEVVESGGSAVFPFEDVVDLRP
jgi:hypothetical protein